MVVGVAFPGGQTLESRLDESQLFEPIQGLGGEDENAGHADPLGFLDEIRENLSAHAQVTVSGIRSNRGDFALAFPVVVKGCTSVDDIVDRVDDVVALVRHQVVFGPFDENAFFHEGLHEAQHVADVVRFHGTNRLVVVGVNHGPDAQVRENLPQNRAFHPAIDNVGALGSLAASRERELEIFQIGIGITGVEPQNLIGLLEAEPCNPAVAVLDQSRRKLETSLHEPVAIGNKKEFLGLESLGDGQGNVVAREVVGFTRGVPPDTWKNRDHPLVENLLERLLKDLLDPAGMLKIQSVNHSDSPGLDEIADYGVRLEGS